MADTNTERADGVTTKWQTVSPHLATKWLEGNTHNRPVRDSAVMEYAADMKGGRWRQSHQGIAFDEDGTLIDGQHRLFAIIEANVPVLLQVTTGLPLATQLVVDGGIKRSVTDVARLCGNGTSGVTNLHAAIAERMYRGLSDSNDARKRTRQEQITFLSKHHEAIDFVVAQFPGSKRVRGVTTAASLAVIARAYYHEDRAVLARFSQMLATGESSDERDLIVVKLRNYLMTRPANSGSVAQRDAFAKTMRALWAFTHGEKVPRSIIAVTTDLYPLKGRQA